MFKNHIKIAIRNMSKHKTYSLINIAGLAIGITGSLLMLSYVLNELSYENFHEQRNNIYRVAVEFGSGGNSMSLAGAMPALGPAIAEELPEVTDAVRFYRDQQALLEYKDRSFIEQNFYFVDPSVFKIFSFNLISGNVEQVLNDPFSLVISKRIAKKYFGGENPVGRVIQYKNEHPLKITGVFEDLPNNTHLRSDFLVSYSTKEKISQTELAWNQFGDTYTYIMVRENTRIHNLNEKISSLLEEHTNVRFANMIQFHLQPLSDIYLHSKMMGELSQGGNITYVYLFSSVAILVLIIASLNFINLSTARSFHRSREIGTRKVLGAGRIQLVRQFIGESLVYTGIAMTLSVLLFQLLLPRLNQFLGTEIAPHVVMNYNFNTLVILIYLLVSLIAGAYPAFYLSGFKPAHALKSKETIKPGKSPFRISLVIVQFVISIFLILGVFVTYQQLIFMKKTDLGFDKQNVVLISFNSRKDGEGRKYDVLKNRIKANADVLDFSGAYTVPGLKNKEQQSVAVKGSEDTEIKMMRAIGVDYNYVNTLGLEIVAGRDFSDEFGTDKNEAVILNETAVRYLGISDNPVARELLLPGGQNGQRPVKVIGVIRDFHVQSMQNKIEPLFLYINPDRFYTLAVKFRSEKELQILNFLKDVWNEVLPEKSFNYNFLSNTYDQLYQSEEKIGQMVTIFSVLAILISCLGLFGLASFTVQRKTKEIGVRKVLGATVSGILFSLSRQYIKLVLIASLIAFPLSWYLLEKWLQNYAYRIHIGWWNYILAGSIAMIVALFAVSFQAIKAAVANPVDSLRYE